MNLNDAHRPPFRLRATSGLHESAHVARFGSHEAALIKGRVQLSYKATAATAHITSTKSAKTISAITAETPPSRRRARVSYN